MADGDCPPASSHCDDLVVPLPAVWRVVRAEVDVLAVDRNDSEILRLVVAIFGNLRSSKKRVRISGVAKLYWYNLKTTSEPHCPAEGRYPYPRIRQDLERVPPVGLEPTTL